MGVPPPPHPKLFEMEEPLPNPSPLTRPYELTGLITILYLFPVVCLAHLDILVDFGSLSSKMGRFIPHPPIFPILVRFVRLLVVQY